MEPKPGDKLGPYEILARIGAGGMGEVWKARDTRLNREVAIKFSQAQFTDRFQREANAIAALNHPNICTLFDVGPNPLSAKLAEIGDRSRLPAGKEINPVAGKGRNRMNTSILNTRGDAGQTAKRASRQMNFEIEQRDDICIIRISGRLATGASADHLPMKAQAIKSTGCNKLIADIGELDSIGSEGIGFFVDLHTLTTKDAAGRFVLAGPSARVLEVLTLTGLSSIIPMAKDLAAALAYCAQEGDRACRAAPHAG